MNRSFELFRKTDLFSRLDEHDLHLIFSIAKEISYKKGITLIEEGKGGGEIFVILEGLVQVMKKDPITQKNHLISTLKSGEIVGELSFFDHGAPSATISTQTEVLALKISHEELRNATDKMAHSNKLLLSLAEKISLRIRNLNDQVIQALSSQIKESQYRIKMGTFLIALISMISFFIFLIPVLRKLIRTLPNSSYISIPLTLVFGCSILFLVRHAEIPIKKVGLTLKGWKKAVLEGFFFTLPVAGLLFLAKWILLTYDPLFQGEPFFNPFSMIPDPSHKNWSYWLKANLIYGFLFIPLQEVLVRGGLQGLLETFLVNRHRIWTSIFLSNLIFGAVHVLLSPMIAIGVFLSGIFMGWLYSRHHNLFGCSIAHFIIGTLVLSVLGFIQIH